MLRCASLSLAALLLIVLTGTVRADDERHLFIISGQSNTAGIDLNRFSFSINHVIDTSRTVIVKDHQPGAPMLRWYKNWTKADGAADPVVIDTGYAGYYGDLYDRLMAKVSPAIAGKTLLSANLIWMQGEEDASTRINGGAVYLQSLHGLVAQFETDLGITGMNVALARISDYGFASNVLPVVPDWGAVREAQVAFAESDPRYGWFDTDAFNDPNDDIHYPAYGYKLLTQSFADKSLELLQPYTDEVSGYSYLTYPDTLYYDRADSTARMKFVDNFEDSNLAVDVSLNSGTVQGLGWEHPGQNAEFFIRSGEPDTTRSLCIPYGNGTTANTDLLIKSVQGDTGDTWKNYAVDFRVYNHNIGGWYGEAGICLLMNGFDTYYVFSTTFLLSSFKRVMPDSEGVPQTRGMFACTQLEVPAGAVGYYRVAAAAKDDGIYFYFGYGTDPDEARKIRRVCVDTDPAAIAAFRNGGGIGFYKNYPYATSYQSYDDISVKVFSFAGDDTVSVVTPGGIPDAGAMQSFSNPVSGPVDFTVTGVTGPLMLLDVTGRPVADVNGEGGCYLLDPSGLRPGMYLLRADGGELMRRVIIME